MKLLLNFQGAASGSNVPQDRATKLVLLRIFAGFWTLGLLNNSAYVIMIAGANEIAASAVGLVYLFAIGPTIVVKLTAPYWFHLVGYSTRFWVAAALMSCSFIIVGCSSSMTKQLLGVALVAIQGGLGEASALGLCSLYPNQLSLTAWSSGTGFAGIAGYAWVAILHYWLGLSYTATLLLANVIPVAWLAVFHLGLQRVQPSQLSKAAVDYQPLPVTANELHGAALDVVSPSEAGETLLRLRAGSSSRPGHARLELSRSPSREAQREGYAQDQQHSHQQQQQQHWQQQQQDERLLPDGVVSSSVLSPAGSVQIGGVDPGHVPTEHHSPSYQQHRLQQEQQQHQQQRDTGHDASAMTFRQRLKVTCGLWPYMVPLFVVYFAEYAMQSGTWTAIGFPVTSADARHKFYLYSNWLYQAGVCVSRSSGMLYQANRVVLWLMPGLQCLLLVFFTIDAVTHIWYNWGLLSLCFVAGLLGGAVYVNSFTLLSKEVEPGLREFSLSAACVADSLGIACADVAAIAIQGCLFRWQHLPGAAYACGST